MPVPLPLGSWIVQMTVAPCSTVMVPVGVPVLPDWVLVTEPVKTIPCSAPQVPVGFDVLRDADVLAATTTPEALPFEGAKVAVSGE